MFRKIIAELHGMVDFFKKIKLIYCFQKVCIVLYISVSNAQNIITALFLAGFNVKNYQ